MGHWRPMVASKGGSAIYQQLEHCMQAGMRGARVQALLLGGQSLKSQPPHTPWVTWVPEVNGGK
jgi:hypothetical protein